MWKHFSNNNFRFFWLNMGKSLLFCFITLVILIIFVSIQLIIHVTVSTSESITGMIQPVA